MSMGSISTLKWLYPGMRVKRWLLLATLGVVLIALGGVGAALIGNMAILDRLGDINNLSQRYTGRPAAATIVPAGLALIALGVLCLAMGIRGVVRSIASVIYPHSDQRLADVVFRKRYLQQGANIVVVGGGTGLSTMLRGLKEYSSNITAIVTVSDDGGSSGRLQREFGMLPPGDIRNCLVALADREPEMREVFQHRFNGEMSELSGHSLGNLILAGMTQLHGGDFERAVRAAAGILAIRGVVLPSTTEPVTLKARMADGSLVVGETNITKTPVAVDQVMIEPAAPHAVGGALEAIAAADLIVLGPGSVYTSVIPDLLIPEITDAISRSRALKVYICNVMTQPGETDGYSACDHVDAIVRHAGKRVFEHVLVNNRVPRADLLERYAHSGQKMVEPDVERIRRRGYRCIVGDFISETDLVRHDPEKLARAIARLVD